MLESFQQSATRLQQLGYGILRAFLGLCFLAHAMVLLFAGEGLAAVANHMLFTMAETGLPQNLIVLFAYSMPAADVLIGSVLILGVGTLPAILLAYVFLCVLMINYTLATDWPSVAVTAAAGLALTFLLIGHRRFDTPWHRLLFPRRKS